MQSVIESSIFTRRADALLSAEERKELVDFLALNPTAGDLVIGLGGVRKVRFAAGGRGKSGAFRVIYYFMTENAPLYALLIYGKNERSDLSSEQRKAISGAVDRIKAAHRSGSATGR